MNYRILPASLVIGAHVLSVVTASTIEFVTPKKDFIPNLTSTLDLTCTFNGSDVATTVGPMVIGRRGISNSTSGVKFLSSLIIVRNGNENVASITEHMPATALMDLTNLKVDGQLSGNSGFLHLSWTYPSDAQAGSYMCESNGMTSSGHFVTLKEHLELGKATPSVTDLVKYIGDQQKAIAGLEQTVEHLQTTVTDQQREITNLRNVQTGIIDCGRPTGYVGNLKDWDGQQDKYKMKTVNFNQTYIRAPEVHLSFGFVDESCHAFFRADLLSVTASNFTMRCRGYAPCLPDYMLVNWVSIPQ